MICPRIRRITSSFLTSSSSGLVTWLVQNIYFSKLEIHTYPLLFVKVAFTWGAREGLERAYHFQTPVSDCRGFSFEEFVTCTQINSIKLVFYGPTSFGMYIFFFGHVLSSGLW